jgi:hypothetical protein
MRAVARKTAVTPASIKRFIDPPPRSGVSPVNEKTKRFVAVISSSFDIFDRGTGQ